MVCTPGMASTKPRVARLTGSSAWGPDFLQNTRTTRLIEVKSRGPLELTPSGFGERAPA